jgi:fructose/tagatose bisphosphate aldolase
MIVDLSRVLKPARQGRYAVGAFNIYNLETIHAVLAAADELRSPVILALGERYLKDFPIRAISAITTVLASDSRVPVALHLDHAQKIESAPSCRWRRTSPSRKRPWRWRGRAR